MLDKLGIIGSAICAIHCALPLILSFISPSLSSYFGNEKIHLFFLITIIPLALFSFLSTKRTHKNLCPTLLGSVGFFLLIFAFTAGPYLKTTNENFELFFTVLGSLVLITAHLINHRLIQKSH